MTGMLSHRRRCASDLPAGGAPWQAAPRCQCRSCPSQQQEPRHALRHFRHLGADRPVFAASAVQAGGEVTLTVEGAGAKLVPVGPPNQYEEVAAHPKATLWACKPCVEVRGLAGAPLDRRIKLGGMNEFHAAAKGADARVINY